MCIIHVVTQLVLSRSLHVILSMVWAQLGPVNMLCRKSLRFQTSEGFEGPSFNHLQSRVTCQRRVPHCSGCQPWLCSLPVALLEWPFPMFPETVFSMFFSPSACDSLQFCQVSHSKGHATGSSPNGATWLLLPDLLQAQWASLLPSFPKQQETPRLSVIFYLITDELLFVDSNNYCFLKNSSMEV